MDGLIDWLINYVSLFTYHGWIIHSLAKPRIQSQIWLLVARPRRCYPTLTWKPLPPLQSTKIPQQSPRSRLRRWQPTLPQLIVCRKGCRIDRSKTKRDRRGADEDLSSIDSADAPLRESTYTVFSDKCKEYRIEVCGNSRSKLPMRLLTKLEK